jgi:serpin B
MKKRIFNQRSIILCILAGALAAGCLPQNGIRETRADDLPGLEVLESQAGRDTSPSISEADLDALVSGNSAFALDFYHLVRQRSDGNIFFSPYSLSQALAMTYAGARNRTERQMAEVLHFELPQATLHTAFNALDLALSERDDQALINSKKSQAFQLDIANSLWGERTYPFLAEFIDLLGRQYGAGLRIVDFIQKPEESRQVINQWVLLQTQEKIKDLLPEDSIETDTRLVLVNAIYFNADWLNPFEGGATSDWPFTLLDGSQVNVPMMSLEHPTVLASLAGQGFQAVELPYVGETVSMVLVVPDPGSYADFEAGMELGRFQEIIRDLSFQTVALSLPRFSFESEFQLKESLSEMGMIDAFSAEDANLSGIDGTQQLYIDNVYHKAYIDVDEKGTEAAAASAVVVAEESALMGQVSLTVDRPFMFFILDKPTGTILFMGRVLNPLD